MTAIYSKPFREVEFGNEAEEIRGLRAIVRQKDDEIRQLHLEVAELQRQALQKELALRELISGGNHV